MSNYGYRTESGEFCHLHIADTKPYYADGFVEDSRSPYHKRSFVFESVTDGYSFLWSFSLLMDNGYVELLSRFSNFDAIICAATKMLILNEELGAYSHMHVGYVKIYFAAGLICRPKSEHHRRLFILRASKNGFSTLWSLSFLLDSGFVQLVSNSNTYNEAIRTAMSKLVTFC